MTRRKDREQLLADAVTEGRIPADRLDTYRAALAGYNDATAATFLAMLAPVGTDAQVQPGIDPSRQGAAEQNELATPTPVERIRAVVGEATWSAILAEEGPPPTPFAEGTLPAFTVSGVPVSVITRLPWQAMIAAAYAGTPAEVRAIIDAASGPGGALNAANEYTDHPAVQAWEAAVREWASGTPRTPEQLREIDAQQAYADLFGE